MKNKQKNIHIIISIILFFTIGFLVVTNTFIDILNKLSFNFTTQQTVGIMFFTMIITFIYMLYSVLNKFPLSLRDLTGEIKQ
jgi:hypothetical protein